MATITTALRGVRQQAGCPRYALGQTGFRLSIPGPCILALALLGTGCVDFTPPWERVSAADAANATGTGGQAAPVDDTGTGGVFGSADGPTSTPEVLSTAETGLGGNTLDGRTSLPDVPATGFGDDAGADGPPGAGSSDDGATDTPLIGSGGTGGSVLDAPAGDDENAQGGNGGATTGRGGAGGTASGSGGGGRRGTGGSKTGGATGAGGRGTGGGSGAGGISATGGSVPIDAGGLCTGYLSPDAGADAGLAQGLVAYYPCDETSGSVLHDESASAKDGALHTGTGGNPGYSFGAGQKGNALHFTVANEGYASLPAGLLANACDVTVATWVYLNTVENWQRVFDFGRDQNVYMFLTTKNSVSSVLRFAISVSGNKSNEQLIDGEGALPTGGWNHVAVVLGPSGGFLYLNGAQVGANPTMTLRPADLGDPPNYYIGRSQFSADPYLDGNIDDFRVYNRALSPAEIQALASGS